MKKKIFTAISLMALFPAVAFAVPLKLAFNGYVQTNGMPFTGAGSVKVLITDSLETATHWSNDGTSATGSEPTNGVDVTVSNGSFVVILGDTTLANMTALTTSIFNTSDTLYFKVWFNDGTHGYQALEPLMEIVSSAYAMNAQTLQNYSLADFFLQTDIGSLATQNTDSVAITGGTISGATVTSPTITSPTVSGGTMSGGAINNTTIGATTPAAGTFSTLASGSATLIGGTINNMTVGATTPAAGTFSTLASGNATLTDGTINNTTIGATTPAAGTFSTLSSSSAALTGGTINNMAIGGSTPAAGVFSALTSGSATLTGGTINNTVIGGTTPVAGTSTTLSSSSTVTEFSGASYGGGAVKNVYTQVTSSGDTYTVATLASSVTEGTAYNFILECYATLTNSESAAYAWRAYNCFDSTILSLTCNASTAQTAGANMGTCQIAVSGSNLVLQVARSASIDTTYKMTVRQTIMTN